MAQIVRAWRVTPPAGLEHPKTEMLRTAARLGTIAVRARKLDSAGVMYLVARGKSEDLAAFAANLHHKQKDEGWAREELLATAADEALLEGGGTSIVRTGDAHTAGADSSGSKAPEALPAAWVDTGSTASSRLIKDEVRRERERNEAAAAVALAAALAAAEARAAREREAAMAEREAAMAEREAAILAFVGHSGMAYAEAALLLFPGRGRASGPVAVAEGVSVAQPLAVAAAEAVADPAAGAVGKYA